MPRTLEWAMRTFPLGINMLQRDHGCGHKVCLMYGRPRLQEQWKPDRYKHMIVFIIVAQHQNWMPVIYTAHMATTAFHITF